MEAADILSLNDDCILHIVASISDPSSFHSLTRTCRRLQQLTSDPRNWHIDIVRSRAKYFVKCLVVHFGDRLYTPDLCYDMYDEFHKFKELVTEACHYSSSLLTYDTVVRVWENSGPVASEVLKWIRSYCSSVSEGEPRPTHCTQASSFTVHLPKRDQEMTVDIIHWYAYDEYDDELKVEVKCGDRKIEMRDPSGLWLRSKKFWSDEKVKQLVESMKPVTEILQKELGETIPPIHAKFLYWFIYIFPGKMKWNEEKPDRMSWDKEEKLIFKDAAKNEKPNFHSIQPMLKDFQKNYRRGFQTASARWIDKKAFPDEAETCKFVIESLDVLVQRSDDQFLRNIKDYSSRIFDIITQDYVKHLPEKLMSTLIKRTSLATDKSLSVTTSQGGFRKYVDNSVSFKLAGNKVIEIEGVMEDDGILVPNNWDRLSLNFLLPDNTKINLDVDDMIDHAYEAVVRKLDVAHLRPVTKLLQECINKGMEGEKSVPEIKDMFTAVYFISAVDFLGECDSFLYKFQDVSDLLVFDGKKS